MSVNSYIRPAAIPEALEALRAGQGRARLVAGATDLFLDMEHGKKGPEQLVDIRFIPELRQIQEEDGAVFIGAAVTHGELEKDPLIRQYFPALAQGAATVGGPQIRSIGTIGGNVVNAQPAADTAVPLFVFDAEALTVDVDGTERMVPIRSLYEGPGRSALDSTRCLLKGFRLPTGIYPVSGFIRESKRKALSLPTLNAAAALRLEDGVIAAAALAAGPVALTPLRLTDAEALLFGKAPSPELFHAAGAAARAQAHPRDSLLRGGGEFRRELLAALLEKLLASLCACAAPEKEV